MTTRWKWPAMTAFWVAAAAGCGGSEDDSGPAIVRPTGVLVTRWTIEGARAPEACSAHDADRFRLVVNREPDVVVATAFTRCAAFELTLTLDENVRYEAYATLLGADGRLMSNLVPVPAFSVARGQTTERAIDFSSASLVRTSEDAGADGAAADAGADADAASGD